MTQKLLICDTNNLYFRSYTINPTMSTEGVPVGGVVGLIQSFQKILCDFEPNRIVISWDGAHGSARRKKLKKDYKDGRSVPKLNWSNSFMSDEDKEENKFWQMRLAYQIFCLLPVNQFCFDDVESDDIIAYICQSSYFADYRKCIVSSDKDFLQLLDKNTVLYRPVQKEVLNVSRVKEKYGIHPNNFILARSLAGDSSDNIEGVGGLGLKTIAKRLPFLNESKQYDIDDVVQYATEQLNSGSSLKIWENISKGKEKIRNNYNLIQLVIPKISVQDTKKINDRISNFIPSYSRIEFYKLLSANGITGLNCNAMEMIFNRMTFDYKRNKKEI